MALRGVLHCLTVVALAFLLFAICAPREADAHHTGRDCGGGSQKCLPLLPTAFVRNLWATGEMVYCLDNRAAAYPGFSNQVDEVATHIASTLGISQRRVGFGTPSTTGCWVQLTMPDNHGCSGCAAWIHYANSPALVEFKYQLGYTSWRSTIGHELGHLFGIHEQYLDDSFQSHILTRGYWASDGAPGRVGSPTVMDFGTSGIIPPYGAWAFTAWDARIICEVIDRTGARYTGCGYQEPPPRCESNPCWLLGRWRFSDGWSCDPSPGWCDWFRPDGILEWGECNADRACWNHRAKEWVFEGSHLYADGYHLYPPLP